MSSVIWDTVNIGSDVIISSDGSTATFNTYDSNARSSTGKNKGKVYAEIAIKSGSSFNIAIVDEDKSMTGRLGNAGAKSIVYRSSDGRLLNNQSTHIYGEKYQAGDVVSILLDFQNYTVEFWKNGVSQGVVPSEAGFDMKLLTNAHIAVGKSSSVAGETVFEANFERKHFKYAPPNGYVAFEILNKFLISSDDGTYKSVRSGGYTTNQVPVMTSNTAPSGIASVSNTSHATNNGAWKAFDDNSATFWYTSAGNTTGWIKYQFTEKKCIKKYILQSQSPTYMVKSWNFEGSNDNSTWVILDTQTNQTNWVIRENREFTTSNTNSYLYYRINVFSTNGGDSIALASFEMIGYIEPLYTLLSSMSEQTFINHGMDKSASMNLNDLISKVVNVESNYTVLGSGKVFKKTIDTTKAPIKKASIE